MSVKFQSQLIQENGFRIFIMTWNTASIRLCETMDIETKEYNRSTGLLGIKNIDRWYDCDIADFFRDLSDKIIQLETPDLVVIGFQEDSFPGSYFHSHMLQDEMPKLGYDFVKRTKLQGIGVTTYKAAKNWDIMARGLRLSIYARKSLIKFIKAGEVDLVLDLGNDGQSYLVSGINQYTRGKGAISSYIIYPGIGKMVFICTHLPFNSKSLIEYVDKNDPMIRQDVLGKTNKYFNNILRHFVKDHTPSPDYVFFVGDFNDRILYPFKAREFASKILENPYNIDMYQDVYLKYDEMHQQMKMGTIYGMFEGVRNKGPMFAPTCKMSKNRDVKKCKLGHTEEFNDVDEYIDTEEFYKSGKHNQRVPSWCDRIIYANYNSESPFNLTCTYYDKFDTGNVMAKSDHAAVIGVFKLSYDKGLDETNNFKVPLN